MAAQKPREIAIRILLEREGKGGFVEDLLEVELPRLAPVDRGLCQELVCGVVRWQATLDWLITRKTEGRTQKVALQNLIRLGLYQLFWLDRVPAHAAVNESVALARQLGFGPQAGFVNAMLRGYAREREETLRLLRELKESTPAIGHSHPEWLCRRWEQHWGAEHLRRLLDWNNTPPRNYARLNSLKIDPGKLLEQWRHEGVEYDFFRADWIDENLVFELKSHPPLAGLPSFQQGGFYVQDPGTLLSVQRLDPKPGETILDLCSAPGGKTTYIAQLMQNRGRIVAQDRHLDRLERVKENCARLGVDIVETSRGEGVIFPELNVHFDRILVDAPCTNTGVMRRRVDLRWRLRPEELDRLRVAQLELVRDAVGILKPGGRLVYSTCSLEPEENREVTRQLLEAHPELTLESERELLPFRDGVDGAYVAAFKRPEAGPR